MNIGDQKKKKKRKWKICQYLWSEYPFYSCLAITKYFIPVVFIILINSIHKLQCYSSKNCLYIWQAILKWKFIQHACCSFKQFKWTMIARGNLYGQNMNSLYLPGSYFFCTKKSHCFQKLLPQAWWRLSHLPMFFSFISHSNFLTYEVFSPPPLTQVTA